MASGGGTSVASVSSACGPRRRTGRVHDLACPLTEGGPELVAQRVVEGQPGGQGPAGRGERRSQAQQRHGQPVDHHRAGGRPDRGDRLEVRRREAGGEERRVQPPAEIGLGAGRPEDRGQQAVAVVPGRARGPGGGPRSGRSRGRRGRRPDAATGPAGATSAPGRAGRAGRSGRRSRRARRRGPASRRAWTAGRAVTAGRVPCGRGHGDAYTQEARPGARGRALSTT